MNSTHADVMQLTKDLIACPSHAEVGEREAALVAREAMTKLGYQDVTIDDLGNVTGVIRGDGSASGYVVFDSHLDTVGVGDPDAWMTPPYTGTEIGPRLHGRGSADMKGALAGMICGIARLLDDPPACDIVVSASIAEELVEGYALGAVLDRYPAKAVVIGEATDLHIARAQRGRAEILVETRGIPAHSSTPHLGVNAVKSMAAVITALSNLEMPESELLGPAVLEVTDVKSEPYPGLSVIPERCYATFDRRLLVGESEAAVLGQVEAALDALKDDFPQLQAFARIALDEFTSWNGAEVRAPNFSPAWEVPVDAPIVQAAEDGLDSIGIDALIGHYAFCTNGSESAGRRDIPTIGFGPGNETQAHTIDESVPISQLHTAADAYAALAKNLARLS
ncbi:MAG: YgeY family selenium metabolism-linked hydrolase [Chloroflexota bacterium]